MAIVQAVELWKGYEETEGRLEILQGLNLQIEEGESVAITGESGSGKSTLLHLLGLLDIPDKGRIYFQQELLNPQNRQADKFRNRHLGFVFQFHYLLPDFTALENIALPNFYLYGKLKPAREKAKLLLEKLNLLDRAEHYPDQLSGGEQQRVAVARALINEPDIIYMDEPTGNLDKKHSDELTSILLKLNLEQNQTMVIVTHDLQLAGLLTKHYRLENGILHLQNK
ncbi:MAG: ABC transporter ATP-binding protein [Candidatus Cloacimonetes bacterium]|nr:ABC transporter ATP-binding protein [Candidatus Cloacimonadota bacterium]